MGGLAGISAANGWLMAVLGMSVVFAGLASFSLILSCFSRIIDWQKAPSPKPVVLRLKGLFCRPEEKGASPAPGAIFSEGKIEDVEETLHALTASLGEPFKLPQLLELSARRNLPSPHSHLNHLLLIGRVVGGADGLFRWEESQDKPMAFSDLTEFW